MLEYIFGSVLKKRSIVCMHGEKLFLCQMYTANEDKSSQQF